MNLAAHMQTLAQQTTTFHFQQRSASSFPDHKLQVLPRRLSSSPYSFAFV